MYVVTIKDAGAWLGDSPFELSMIGFWNLIIIWLKVILLNHPLHTCANSHIAFNTLAILPPMVSL